MFLLLICVVGFDCEQPTVELLVFLQRAAKIRDPPTQGYPTLWLAFSVPYLPGKSNVRGCAALKLMFRKMVLRKTFYVILSLRVATNELFWCYFTVSELFRLLLRAHHS